MECGDATGVETLALQVSRQSADPAGDCTSIALNLNAEVGDAVECDTLPFNTAIARLVENGMVNTNVSSGGAVEHIGCDESGTPLSVLFGEAIIQTPDGHLLLLVWDGEEAADCSSGSCSDTEHVSLAQRIRGTFVRLENGELRIRITPSNEGAVATCAHPATAASTLSAALLHLGDERWAWRYIQEA